MSSQTRFTLALNAILKQLANPPPRSQHAHHHYCTHGPVLPPYQPLLQFPAFSAHEKDSWWPWLPPATCIKHSNTVKTNQQGGNLLASTSLISPCPVTSACRAYCQVLLDNQDNAYVVWGNPGWFWPTTMSILVSTGCFQTFWVLVVSSPKGICPIENGKFLWKPY